MAYFDKSLTACRAGDPPPMKKFLLLPFLLACPPLMSAGRMATGETVGRVDNPGDVQKLARNPGGTGGFRFACQH